jgi:hypothetical protein
MQRPKRYSKRRKTSAYLRRLVGKYALHDPGNKVPVLVFVLSKCVIDGEERYLIENAKNGRKLLAAPGQLKECRNGHKEDQS